MQLLRPLPRIVTRPLKVVVLIAWVASMAVLVNRSYLEATPAKLATDLARYGSTAVWRGVYYRGEKIGFTVSQTIRTDQGFELQEDGRLQMMLLGATTAAALRTTARVDRNFALQSFEFSLDPGTGAVQVRGTIDAPARPGGPHRLTLWVTSGGSTRAEQRELPEAPVLSQNLSRVLANGGLSAGKRHKLTILDPATLRNVAVSLDVGRRELVRVAETSVVPAFRVRMDYEGLETTSWITDTGDVIKEESPLGLVSVRESPERARGLAVPMRVQSDLLRAAAVVPGMAPHLARRRIDEPRDVKRLRVQLTGVTLPALDLDGVGQIFKGDSVELIDRQTLVAGPADPHASRYLAPETLIESDDPAIIAEAQKAVAGVEGARARAERLTRYVNGLLDKKPTVSLPSAREVLRTKVGDCNEHTALFVAMARALGIPARIAVGLAYVRGVQGAFYYHAWPEIYLDEGGDRGLWLPVDPTFNQFPADTMHLRLARGGLDQQAVIVPLIGRLHLTIVDIEQTQTDAPPAPDRVEPALAAIPLPPQRPGAVGREDEPTAREPRGCSCDKQPRALPLTSRQSP